MATAAAAIIAKTRQDVIDRFTAVGATGPGSPIAWQPTGPWPINSIATSLMRAGVLVEASVGRYYIDADALARLRRSRRRLALTLLVGSIAATAALVAIS